MALSLMITASEWTAESSGELTRAGAVASASANADAGVRVGPESVHYRQAPQRCLCWTENMLRGTQLQCLYNYTLQFA